MTTKLEDLLREIEVEEELLSKNDYSAHFNSTRSAYEKEDYGETLRLIDVILSMNNLSAEQIIKSSLMGGLAHYQIGNLEKSKELLNSVTVLDDGKYRDEAVRGLEKITLREAEKAISDRDNLLKSRDSALREARSYREKYRRIKSIFKKIGYTIVGTAGLIALSIGLHNLEKRLNFSDSTEERVVADITYQDTEDLSYIVHIGDENNISFTPDRNSISQYGTSNIIPQEEIQVETDTTPSYIIPEEELQEARRSSAIMLASTLGVAIAWEAPQLCERINEYSREGLEEPIFIPSNEQTLENNLEIVEEEEPEIRGVSRVRETRRSRRETSEGVEEQLMETNQRDDERGYRLLSNFEIHGMSDEQIQRSSSCSVFINGRLYGLGSRTPPAFIFRNQDSNTLFTYHFDWRIIGVNSSNINELENFGLYVVRDGNLTTNSGDIIRGLTTEGIPDGENIYIIKDFNYSRLRVYTTSTRSPDNTDFYSIFFEGRYYGATSRGIRITGRDTRDIQNGQRLCFQNGDLYLRLED